MPCRIFSLSASILAYLAFLSSSCCLSASCLSSSFFWASGSFSSSPPSILPMSLVAPVSGEKNRQGTHEANFKAHEPPCWLWLKQKSLTEGRKEHSRDRNVKRKKKPFSSKLFTTLLTAFTPHFSLLLSSAGISKVTARIRGSTKSFGSCRKHPEKQILKLTPPAPIVWTQIQREQDSESIWSADTEANPKRRPSTIKASEATCGSCPWNPPAPPSQKTLFCQVLFCLMLLCQQQTLQKIKNLTGKSEDIDSLPSRLSPVPRLQLLSLQMTVKPELQPPHGSSPEGSSR